MQDQAVLAGQCQSGPSRRLSARPTTPTICTTGRLSRSTAPAMASALAPVADDLPTASSAAESLQCYGDGRSSGWTFTRSFSCERDEAKQAWVLENFPEAPMIFPDMCALRAGRALNDVTREVIDAPAVGALVAGFVCKSVSTGNTAGYP